MQLSYPARMRHRIAKGWRLLLVVVLAVSLSLILNACGGDPRVQQAAEAARTQFMQALGHAQQIGVPANSLQTVLQQQHQLSASNPPFNLFGIINEQATKNYYTTLATSYRQLNKQLQNVIVISTLQAKTEAQQNLQTTQRALDLAQRRHLPVKSLLEELTREQHSLARAQAPRDYQRVSHNVQTIGHELLMLSQIASSLRVLNQRINQLQQAGLDVSGMKTLYQEKEALLGQKRTPADFRQLDMQTQADIQQVLTVMTQAIPTLVKAKIAAFTQQLTLMQTYKVPDSIYQRNKTKLQLDQKMVHEHMNIQDYEAFVTQIDKDLSAALFDQLHGQAQYMLQQFHNDAQNWNANHAYYNAYDGQSYPLNAGYLNQGIGGDLDAELAQVASVDDLKNTIKNISDAQFNLKLLERDYKDSTPYNQVHQTDMQALQHYQLQHGQVIVVSMVEQAMRVYQDGHLVTAFQVTTGRYERPSLPGLWSVLGRESPTVFRSSDPPSSPYWYPPTPIRYAILYHTGGYFIHDAWWRATYGPGTQFPHADAGGNQTFAGNGSHGCINLPENQAAWIFNNTAWKTPIIVY
jgi:lipoprotein-anchoring transpeptidase ErfK/SrfK